MKTQLLFALAGLIALFSPCASAENDDRQFVQLPEMMQQHMLSNMRDHLQAINDILIHMKDDDLDTAADIAEQRLGMSALNAHGASHMAKFMPQGMQDTGFEMHKSASRFALKAQEGDAIAAYNSLFNITSACVACHSAYRIQ